MVNRGRRKFIIGVAASLAGGSINKGALITRDFTPRVLIAYALDNAQSYKLVTPEMLKQWNVSTEVLHEAAVASLEKVSIQVPIHVEHSPTTGKYAIVSTRDGYEPRRGCATTSRASESPALGS
jgi:uncharacterized protein YtpQ (UPF0354 family)